MKRLCAHPGFEIIWDDVYRNDCPYCEINLENIRLQKDIYRKNLNFKWRCKCGLNDFIFQDRCDMCGEKYRKEYIE